jgi:hypothetical protein
MNYTKLQFLENLGVYLVFKLAKRYDTKHHDLQFAIPQSPKTRNFPNVMLRY